MGGLAVITALPVANVRLSGGDPTLRTGLAGAATHFWAILGWAVVSATVGFLLRLLTRGRNTRWIANAVLGTAWSMGTYFVVPLLVIEGKGFSGSISSSAVLFKRTWGERASGNFGLGFAQFLLTVIVIASALGLANILQPISQFGASASVLIGIVSVALIILVFSTLDGIYKAALYRYATTGEISPGFPEDVVLTSWRRR